MSENIFKKYPFGVETEEEFAAAVNKHLEAKRRDQQTDLGWLDMLDEGSRQNALEAVNASKESFAAFEKAVEDMPALYQFVRGIYDELLALDEAELETLDIVVGKNFSNRRDQIRPITELIENGLTRNSWGYLFIGALKASFFGEVKSGDPFGGE